MRSLLCALSLALPLWLVAQQTTPKEYTYVSDRIVSKSDDLLGYTIFPAEGKLSNAPITRPVKLGLVQFKISATGLTVQENVKFSTTGIISENDVKNYRVSIPRIDETDYGFELVLMDLQNPDVQGYLKVVRNGKRQIERVQFRPTMADPERTYFLANTPADIEGRDNRFFTHIQDVDATTPLDLWSRKTQIIPFAQIAYTERTNDFTRLYPSDRVRINFEERTELKGKKEKLTQYIVLQKPNAAGADESQEFLIRKIKEVADPQHKSIKHIVLDVTLNGNETNSFITIFRTAQNTISSVDFGNLSYLMRDGKRKAS